MLPLELPLEDVDLSQSIRPPCRVSTGYKYLYVMNKAISSIAPQELCFPFLVDLPQA